MIGDPRARCRRSRTCRKTSRVYQLFAEADPLTEVTTKE
jgi:hypothetical protein